MGTMLRLALVAGAFLRVDFVAVFFVEPDHRAFIVKVQLDGLRSTVFAGGVILIPRDVLPASAYDPLLDCHD